MLSFGAETRLSRCLSHSFWCQEDERETKRYFSFTAYACPHVLFQWTKDVNATTPWKAFYSREFINLYMRQVLRAVLDCLPVAPRVKRFVADFERGLWQAIRSVFRSPQVRGCNFHWAQSVWRKVQELGLQVFTVLLLVRRYRPTALNVDLWICDSCFFFVF